MPSLKLINMFIFATALTTNINAFNPLEDSRPGSSTQIATEIKITGHEKWFFRSLESQGEKRVLKKGSDETSLEITSDAWETVSSFFEKSNLETMAPQKPNNTEIPADIQSKLLNSQATHVTFILDDFENRGTLVPSETFSTKIHDIYTLDLKQLINKAKEDSFYIRVAQFFAQTPAQQKYIESQCETFHLQAWQSFEKNSLTLQRSWNRHRSYITGLSYMSAAIGADWALQYAFPNMFIFKHGPVSFLYSAIMIDQLARHKHLKDFYQAGAALATMALYSFSSHLSR